MAGGGVGGLWWQVKYIFSRKGWAFGVSLLVRCLLLLWGHYQDLSLRVKYTDVDYEVYTDGAGFVSQGLSPYLRSTFRYTPLLAWLLVPNVHFKLFGKLLFMAADMATGLFIYWILKLQSQRESDFRLTAARSRAKAARPKSAGRPQSSAAAEEDYQTYVMKLIEDVRCVQYTSLWLFNPFVFNVSTRGNADSLLALLITSTLWCLMKGRFTLAALLFGVSIHFKLVPVIFGLAFLLFVDFEKARGGLFSLFSKNRLKFVVVTLGTFAAITGTCYYLYGNEFVSEAYLYHFTRADHRHNFSPQFYPIYLKMGIEAGGNRSEDRALPEWEIVSSPSVASPASFLLSFLPHMSSSPPLNAPSNNAPSPAPSLPFLSSLPSTTEIPAPARALLDLLGRYSHVVAPFLPQLALILVITIVYYRDLPFCIFLITFVFVSFNKVITVQYFVWFLALLPMAMKMSRMTIPRDLILNFAVWYVPQALWLLYGYRLEFLGENTYMFLYLAGLLCFASNMVLLWRFVLHHNRLFLYL